jgi:uncharacterized integral membrane protein (TIGR00698 family)
MNKYIKGLSVASVIGILSVLIASIPSIKSSLNINPLVIATLIGLVIGNSIKFDESYKSGLTFSMKKVLRLAIILLGFKLTFQSLMEIGIYGFITDLIMVATTFFFSVFVSKKFFKLDDQITYLLASGCSICGASAILATVPIVKSENHHTAMAVGTITIFGTISMFTYPLLYKFGLLPLTEVAYGVFSGSSIHEVAQVVVAGFTVSETAGKIATLTKLARVIMLAPVLILLSMYMNKKNMNHESSVKSVEIPWFVFGFIAVAGVNSLGIIPKDIVDLINQLNVYLFAISMGALGIETNINKIRGVGLAPVYSGLVILFFLFSMGLITTSLFF